MSYRLYLLLLCAILICGCESTGIPDSAYSVAENDEWAVFLNDEAVEEGDGISPRKQVSLWVYNKSKRSARKVLLSHLHANGSWFSMEHAVRIPVDSIATISRVTIISWIGEPLKILAEGCSDYRNVESYIISEGSDTAICLPTNRGLIGLSEEDRLLIMQSYEYYPEGCRYNIIEAFDDNGKRIASMDAKVLFQQ